MLNQGESEKLYGKRDDLTPQALDGSITEIDQKARTHILKGKGNGLEDLGPESDAVIFFTSGYVTYYMLATGTNIHTGLEVCPKQCSALSVWPCLMCSLALLVSMVFLDVQFDGVTAMSFRYSSSYQLRIALHSELDSPYHPH